MVGEIRDRETAEVAIQASLTGHLVFSTIHTNDAAGAHHASRRHGHPAVPRRVVADGAARAAPRAARVPRVPRAVRPSDEDLASIGIDPAAFARGEARRVQFKGDEACAPPPGMLFRAKRGRLHRLPRRRIQGPDGDLRAADHRREDPPAHRSKNADAQSIKNQAVKAGMRTLREDGAQKVLAGMTTTAEVLMITTQDVE